MRKGRHIIFVLGAGLFLSVPLFGLGVRVAIGSEYWDNEVEGDGTKYVVFYERRTIPDDVGLEDFVTGRLQEVVGGLVANNIPKRTERSF